jgi:GNAT superfamily N-acetyltransferase
MYKLISVTEIEDKDALDDLLLEFYTVIVAKYRAVVASLPPDGSSTDSPYSPAELMASFWPNIHKFMPPTGRLVLAHDATGRLVGCGTLQQARPDAGELKRLYVRPEASGHGLGRQLVEARMHAARDMGWRTLLVNTLLDNEDMLRIYRKIGFRFIARYPECSDPVDIADKFHYLQYDFA